MYVMCVYTISFQVKFDFHVQKVCVLLGGFRWCLCTQEWDLLGSEMTPDVWDKGDQGTSMNPSGKSFSLNDLETQGDTFALENFVRGTGPVPAHD